MLCKPGDRRVQAKTLVVRGRRDCDAACRPPESASPGEGSRVQTDGRLLAQRTKKLVGRRRRPGRVADGRGEGKHVGEVRQIFWKREDVVLQYKTIRKQLSNINKNSGNEITPVRAPTP